MKRFIPILCAIFFGTFSVCFAQGPYWSTITNLPTPRVDISTSIVDGKIFTIGGENPIGKPPLSNVEVYDPATNVWNTLADIPTGRIGIGRTSNTTVDKKIFISGGRLTNPGDGISLMEVYDVETDVWDTCANMPTPRCYHATCAVDGKTYAIGGSLGTSAGWVGLKTVERYDPVTDTWDTCADMQTGRWALSVCVLNGKIYAIGGAGSDLQGLSTVEEYDPETDKWTQKENMPSSRFGLAACVVEDTLIWAIGGSDGNVALSTVEEYSPSTNKWTPKYDFNLPTEIGFLSVCSLNDKIYVLGGGPITGSSIPEVLVFDPSDTIVNIPDTAFLHALIDEEVDTNGDSLISYAEAETTISLWISENGISDMTGIDAFVNLDTLDCRNNQLTSLNVSNNSKLRYLDIQNMPTLYEVCVWTMAGVTVYTSGSPNVYFTTEFKNIINIRFGSTGNPLNGLTVTWKNSGTSDSIAWGYTTNLEQGKFKGFKREHTFGTMFDYTFPSLNAVSTIHYALFDSKGSIWTEERTFTTASDTSNNQFSFTVLGDSRTYPDQWKIISEAALETDFTLFMGDVIADGAIQSGWDDWFEYGEEFIAREPVYHCIGNHDEDNSSSGFDTYLSMFTLPGAETYFSFNYGNAVFICLNTEDSGNTAQYNWLLSTLEANKYQTWKFVFFHRPFYTSPTHVGEMDGYFNTWWQAFDDYGVDMIFNGHTHNYQRTKPINRNVNTTSPVANYGSGEGQGRCQIVAGSTGPLSAAADPGLWWLEKSESKRHFCNIDIDGEKLSLKALDANQVVFDEFIIDKNWTGTKDFRSTGSWIYPNPAMDMLTIKTNAPGQHSIEITSLNGQLIYSTQMEGTSHQINISSFQKGVYFITIRSRDYVRTEKIIKL